ncbi:hypothetical protein LG634_14935 [Streptomyces bambusae]|uniref:hypothetical protein n=1 Tax=Streptomyces bambusae TaxID=1550616 RepID=UPI001CFE5FAB|nr:hypothetical protein [Streptomyces bambusae]MCB5166124.1 hypothetical protein [Streptomyces bambusae]
MKTRLLLPAVAGLAALALTAPVSAAEPAASAVPAAASSSAHPVIKLTSSPVNVGLGGWRRLEIRYNNPGPEVRGGYTVTADLAGVAGFIRAEFDEPDSRYCKATGTKITCKPEFGLIREGTADGQMATIALWTLPGAKVGDKGAVTVSVTAPGRTVEPVTTTVEAGGPDLALTMPKHKEKQKPGAKIPLPFTFTNKGTEPVTDVLLTAEATYGIQLGGNHRNCSYRVGSMRGRPTSDVDTVNTYQCRIKGVFRPGKTYRVATPVAMRVAEWTSSWEYFEIRVDEDNAEHRRIWRQDAHKARQGAGPELTATQVPVAAPQQIGEHGRDVNPYNSHYSGSLFVAGAGADFGTVGTTVRGKAGDTVKATVKLRNHGPAYFSAQKAQGILKLPKGVTVVKADPACTVVKRADGTVKYHWCAAVPPGGRSYVKPREEFSYTFTLKLDRTLKNVSGSFSTRLFTDDNEDQNFANDKAPVRVNPTTR